MDHLEQITGFPNAEELKIKLSGKYYTHEFVAKKAIQTLINIVKEEGALKSEYRICDPFSGDGRLVFWFIEMWVSQGLPTVNWFIDLWDVDESGLGHAKKAFEKLNLESGVTEINIINQDSFKLGLEIELGFDFIVTNPPWEMIKPDSRELKEMDDLDKERYISSLKKYDEFLSSKYPLSQPLRKFAGWGTNLSRVGVELSRKILSSGGLCMIVIPTSFLADDQSANLRKELFTQDLVYDIDYYPAEAKLFGKADVNSSVIIFRKGGGKSKTVLLTKYNSELNLRSKDKVDLSDRTLVASEFSLPINTCSTSLQIMKRFSQNNEEWALMEENSTEGFWAGREIDETGSKEWLVPQNGRPWFIKGKMIDRFRIREKEFQSIRKQDWKAPESINQEKIVWRDVSRSNQKRRMIATIIPKGFAAGNSLGVCYFKDGNAEDLRIMLAVLNSLCFEFQLKNYLATGHISLSSLRKTRIPSRRRFKNFGELLMLVNEKLNGAKVESKIEAYVAKRVYVLQKDEFSFIINSFDKLIEAERQSLLREFDHLEDIVADKNLSEVKIYNHLSSSLSDLDMAVVRSVPPGGNWKNIPEDIPSKRIQTIRESYKAGKGSRSTYYGRLLPNMPSYTINTYLNRPGNGCHIHYNQDRVISQREAARLQSFPDSFEFIGSQQSINTQIGNAVPPLLAYQLAEQISKVVGKNGVFVDLFSGAGGMGLGFKWQGWEPLFANDIEKRFLETYAKNVHGSTILGSINDPDIFEEMVQVALLKKKENEGRPFWILGGPPCQGFSTAGKKRTMEDPRNLLFRDYTEFLKIVQPDGFVFENVSGLLNMEGGKVFENVKAEFQKVINHMDGFILQSEHYAIPQRRKRVFLIGQRQFKGTIRTPKILTRLEPGEDLFGGYKPCVSVSEAISDLPKLVPGQNGDNLDYIIPPKSYYQMLMRGHVTPADYLNKFR